MVFNKSLTCSIFDKTYKLFLVTVADGLYGLFSHPSSPESWNADWERRRLRGFVGTT